MTKGIKLINDERDRQIHVEGYDEKHDFQHTADQLICAAVAYLHASNEPMAIGYWPFDDESWKPKDMKSNLIKAGALVAAALDRMLLEEEFEGWYEKDC